MCAACAAFAGGNADKEAQAQVIVNSDLTPEGKARPMPTPEKPAYYVPIILGWSEHGHIVAGEEPPSRKEVLKLVGQALAKRGYVLQALRPKANETIPDVIVGVEWGYLNPAVTDFGEETSTAEPDSSVAATRSIANFNQAEMITLVAGSAIQRKVAFTDDAWEWVRDAVESGRYFIILSAYDFADSLKGKRTLLWRTRMSTEREGVWMSEVVTALVKAGTPLFGRQTDLPSRTPEVIRTVTVTVGESVIQGTEPSTKQSKP